MLIRDGIRRIHRMGLTDNCGVTSEEATADKARDTNIGDFSFLRDLQVKK
jgi:hypothetical protein